METGSWLPLTDYALNNGVSISTLRRKIKTNNVTYKMVEGRYLILDERHSPKASATSFVSTDETPATTAPAQDLQWRALEARVAGLVRKVDLMSEQVSELKMLVQIFEEKLEEQRD
jgi:hypothetical protein